MANIIASHAIARGSIPRVGILLHYNATTSTHKCNPAIVHPFQVACHSTADERDAFIARQATQVSGLKGIKDDSLHCYTEEYMCVKCLLLHIVHTRSRRLIPSPGSRRASLMDQGSCNHGLMAILSAARLFILSSAAW